MYAKVVDGIIIQYPYSIRDLYNEYPDTSFPVKPSDELLESFNIFKVTSVQIPQIDPMTQDLKEGVPALVSGTWQQTWDVIDVSQEEIDSRKQQIDAAITEQRRQAYTLEADPLYFKAQRGEVSIEVWLEKVQEIKQRYPRSS